MLSILRFIWSVFALVLCLHAGSAGISGEASRTILSQSPSGQFPAGAWGNLEAFPLALNPPRKLIYLEQDLLTYRAGTLWKFHRQTVPAVRDLLRLSGIGEERVGTLTSQSNLHSTDDCITVKPSPVDVMSLSREARGRLYFHLGEPGSDDPFYDAYVLDRRGFRHMAIDSGLPEKTIEMVSRLSYTGRHGLSFSDVALVLQQASDDEERVHILTTLGREHSLLLRLDSAEPDTSGEIAAYWTARGKNPDVLPVLEASRFTSGSQELDIVHLLPPTPRKLLHTFSPPNLAVGECNPDCYWTAFNFFSYEPSDRVHDWDYFDTVLMADYERASEPLELGDLILIWDKTRKAPIHACNYVAGNVVFTKNGGSLRRPWVMSHFRDVLGRYLVSDQVGITFFRKRT